MSDKPTGSRGEGEKEPTSTDSASRKKVVIREAYRLRTIVSTGVAAAESISSLLGHDATVEFTDEHFSYLLIADLMEAIEFCVERIIQAGFLSYEVDFWIDTPYDVQFDEPFDEAPVSGSVQAQLKNAMSESQDLMDRFADVLEIKPAIKNTHLIFLEIEKMICRRGVKWSGQTGQRAKMYPTLKTGYRNDEETQFFRQVQSYRGA